MILTSTMEASIRQFSSCFTKPSFQTFCVIVTGWLLGHGRRVVTRILLAGDGLKVKSFSCYHRFFSQARWAVDAIGRVLLALVLKFIPDDAPIIVAVADTLNRKTGKRIWAAGMHHDPLRSTGGRAVFSFGHNWVVLSVQIRLPFAPDKVWSLPVLMRLYRRKQKKRKPGRPRGDPQNRTPLAVQRTAPLALYLHTLVILWFAEHGQFDAAAYRHRHPWYRQKRAPSFVDMLTCLKAASLQEMISRYPGQKPPSAKNLLPLFQALEAAA